MKKGLVIVHDPHNLYQFIWYYCNAGKNKEWDALCLPNGYKGEYMHTYCKTTGIFSNIFRDDTDFSTMKAVKKLMTVLSMTGHFIIGQRKNFCRKLLNSYVCLDDYDELVVIADVGVVTGACVALGDEKKVIILEDGVNDYSVRPKRITKDKWLSFYNWQGFVLSKMGYCSPGWFYFAPDKNCIKYCSQPEQMKYNNYKEMRLLYTEKGTDQRLFDEIVKQTYPALKSLDLDSFDAVLFTRPLKDYVDDDAKYLRRLEAYVNEHFHNVLIKKHPREDGHYHFSDTVRSTEADNAIPAEVMLPYLKNKEIFIIGNSAVSLYMKSFGLHFSVVNFDRMYEESVSGGSSFRPLTDEDARLFCDRFAKGYYSILNL